MVSTICSSLRPGRLRRRPKVIAARAPCLANPALPSFSKLSNELVLYILEIIHDTDPKCLLNIALVCSDLYQKARYVQHRRLVLDFPSHTKQYFRKHIFYAWRTDNTPGRLVADRLHYMQRVSVLSAIRTLDVLIPSIFGEPLRSPTRNEAKRQWNCFRKLKVQSHGPGIDQMMGKYSTWPVVFGRSNQPSSSTPPLINSMPHLRDIHWCCRHFRCALPLPSALVSLLTNKTNPTINLHVYISTDDDRRNNPRLLQLLSQLSDPTLAPTLTSLKLNITYHSPGHAREILHPLKTVLCSAANLQKLSIDIWYRRGGCVERGPDANYYGFGFTSGEKLATRKLKHLTIHNYPFGRPLPRLHPGEQLPSSTTWSSSQWWDPRHWNTRGYPANTVPEVEYWAKNFYWGGLETLQLLNVGWMGSHEIFPSVELAGRLGSLKELVLDGLYGPRVLANTAINKPGVREYIEGPWKFLEGLPVGRLESVSLPFLGVDVIPVEAITRFGGTLTRLDITRHAVKEEDLEVLGRNLLALRELRLWCERGQELGNDDGCEGKWPEKTFEVLADEDNFPRLRDLYLTFELGFKEEHVRPPLHVFAAAKIGGMILVRHNSSQQSSSLQRVHLTAGSPPKSKNDEVHCLTNLIDTAKGIRAFANNRITFICSPGLDDEGMRIRCPKLAEVGLDEHKLQSVWAYALKERIRHGDMRIQEIEDKVVADLGLKDEKMSRGKRYSALMVALKGPQWGD